MMEKIGTINSSWAQGFAGGTIQHVDQDVICYICGSNVKFVNTRNKEEKVFPSPGNGITALAASQTHHTFAVAEACLNPKIFICEYPSMNIIKTLEGGTDLEYKVLAFSTSESYLASCSAIPDFAVTVWDWMSGQSLCRYEMKVDSNIKSMSFSPLNWHQFCACGYKTLYVFSLEKCNKVYMIDPKEIPLPAIEGKSKDDEIMRSETKAGDQLDLVLSSKARLVGHAAKNFKAPHQYKPSVRPTSHCWTSTGEICVGCLGGQLFSVEPDTGTVTEILTGPLDKPLAGEVVRGMFRSISYNLEGMYCGGSDGVLRRFVIDKNGVKISQVYKGTSEILTQSFSAPSYSELTFATTSGSLFVFNLQIGNCRMVVDSHVGQFIGAGYSDGGNICVSCCQNGTVELWESEFGTLVSRTSIGAEATAFAACQSTPIVVVGTSTGHLYHISVSEPANPRVIAHQRLHHGPVDHLMYTALGLHLISCSSEERHILVMNAKPTSGFECVGYVDCCGAVKSITTTQHEKDRTHFAVVVIPIVEKTEEDEEEKSEEPSISDRLMIFSIPNDETSYTEEQYKTTLKDFTNEFIRRLIFNLTLPLDSAIITKIDSVLHVSAIDLVNRNLLCFKFPTIQDDSTSIHNPSHEFDGHQLPNGSLILSAHSQWILSYSPDGLLILRDLQSPESSVVIKAHSYLSGGVSSACLSPDGLRIVSTGRSDMSLVSYSWNLTGKGRVSMNAALEFSRNHDMILRSIAEKEEPAVQSMKSWEKPEKELENDDESSEKTWYDEQLYIANKQENLKYDAAKQELRKNISQLRKMILDMMAENLTRPEVERLNQEEYNLDVEQQKELQDMEEHRVQEVRDGIELENLAEKYLKYIMQKEFWDDMVVKGLALKAFNSSTSMTNYPMRDIIQREVMALNRITAIRAMDIKELNARKEIAEISTGQKNLEEDEEEDEGAVHPDRQLSLHGSVGPKYGGGNDLFYSQFELHTREEKIDQILFLKDAIRKIKLGFNKEFTNAYQNKEQELARAREKNIRIREILEDLDMDASNVKDLDMEIDEKPEKIFTVSDEEVTMERVLSLEQQKQLTEDNKQARARMDAAKSDNKRERGLYDMMAGVLEVKKEDILKQDILLPEFIREKTESDWTEEEKKIMKELEKKQKDLQEEREKYRKNLENELKKLQQAVTEGMATFDEQLIQLYNRKVKTEMIIKQEESKILRLSSAILIDDEINTHEEQLNFSIEYARERKGSASMVEAEIRKLVDEFREMYDSLTAEDKLLDRSFKRDFSDVPLQLIDSLNKLFKRRPRVHRQAVTADTAENFNPYSLESKSQSSLAPGARNLPVVDVSKATLAALSELDDNLNAPDGVNEVLWQRLCSARRVKVESELRVKKHAAALAEMTKYLQHLQDEIEMINSEIQGLEKQQNKLTEDRMRISLNLEIQFLLKQGQVEVETGDFIPVYSDSILIHRPVVEDLNATIRGLGEQKVTAMTECKDFRKGIHQLEWERKRMMMQMDDLHNKARHIQMLKLAKDLQLYLNEENHQARQAKQMQVLEETLALQDKHLEKNVTEKRSTLHELEKLIRHKELENKSLENETEELHVSVSERRNIDDVNADERAKNTADNRLRGIVQRRKLVDLAKAQAQEVAVLRAEVERLRMKTFPALVQIER